MTPRFCCYRRQRVTDSARKTLLSALAAVLGDVLCRVFYALWDGSLSSVEAQQIVRLSVVGLVIVALNAAQTYWQLGRFQRDRRAHARRFRARDR